MLPTGGLGYFSSVFLYSVTAYNAGPYTQRKVETLMSSRGSISMLKMRG